MTNEEVEEGGTESISDKKLAYQICHTLLKNYHPVIMHCTPSGIWVFGTLVICDDQLLWRDMSYCTDKTENLDKKQYFIDFSKVYKNMS